jgi:RNA polymerase sigma-70 factor (ECF subfamily)
MHLVVRAQQGQVSAVERLFSRLLPDVTRWARGRLPAWARARMDTDDLVQEAFGAIFRRLDRFEPRRRQAIRAYLKQSIRNRIRDEVRRAGKVEVPAGARVDRESPQTSPLDRAITAENRRRYLDALDRLSEQDRELVVGRIELDFTYDQLAVATSKPTADAARVAVRRALIRLATEMTAE